MSKLLVSNFARLFKSRLFKICIIFMAVIACTSNISRAIDINKHSELYMDTPHSRSAECFVLTGGLYLIFVIAVFVGSFIGTEYSDGTIRNKISVGQTRLGIYFSNFIALTIAGIILFLVYSAVSLCVGLIVLEPLVISTGELLYLLFMQIIPIIAFSAFMTFITMLIQNKAASSVTVLLVSGIMLISALLIADRLKAPEYLDSYSITSVDPETGDAKYDVITEKNPHYLTGKKRRIFEALNDILPVNQINQISEGRTDNCNKIVIYSAMWIILTDIAGIVLFRKKDLK